MRKRQKRAAAYAAAVLVSAALTAAFTCTSFAGSWEQENGKWWYDLGGGNRATGWQWIDTDGDGKAESYFFDKDGNLLVGTTTPDGFEVNEAGAWIKNGKIQTAVAGVSAQFFQAPPLRTEEAAAEGTEADNVTAAAEDKASKETASAGEKPAEETEAAQETEVILFIPAAAEETEASQRTSGEDSSGAEDSQAGPGAAPEETSETAAQAGLNETGMAIVEKARSFVGVLPYVYGGASLTTGADCAGFTQAIFALFGKTLPRATGAQLEAGTRISKEEVQPGDLVFWANSSGHIYHVGIYSGPDSFIHASNTARGWVFEDHLHDMHEPCGYARY